MKKFFSIVILASVMGACNDSSTQDNASSADSVTTPVETAPAAADNATAMDHAMMKDDLMTMKDGKMMIAKGGKWENMTEPVTCTNGRKVELNGEVSKGDKKKMLTEGAMIDKDGQMMDKDGKMMDNTGW